MNRRHKLSHLHRVLIWKGSLIDTSSHYSSHLVFVFHEGHPPRFRPKSFACVPRFSPTYWKYPTSDRSGKSSSRFWSCWSSKWPWQICSRRARKSLLVIYCSLEWSLPWQSGLSLRRHPMEFLQFSRMPAPLVVAISLHLCRSVLLFPFLGLQTTCIDSHCFSWNNGEIFEEAD